MIVQKMIIPKDFNHDKLDWLVSARFNGKSGKLDRHEVLRHIYVVKSNKESLTGVCTDGHRLHVLHNINNYYSSIEESGFYKIDRNQKKCIELLKIDNTGKFPDYQKVIPTEAPHKVFEWEASCENSNKLSCSTASLFYAFPERTVIGLKFIEDMAHGSESWTVNWYGTREPIKFEATDQLAIVMPINL
jgi:hypothetical protein